MRRGKPRPAFPPGGSGRLRDPRVARRRARRSRRSFHSPDRREADARLRINVTRLSLQSRCAPSFDHLVGAGEQRERESDAEHLGSLEINDQLDLRDSHPCALTQRQLQLLEPR